MHWWRIERRGKRSHTKRGMWPAFRRASEVAEARFRSGLSAYLPVLDSQRELYNAQLEEARIRLAQVVAVTQLYKALGGSY